MINTLFCYKVLCRVLICLLLATGTSLQAQAISPGEKKVTISIQNGTMNEVFKSIHQQTGLLFTYSNDQFDQEWKVTLHVSNSPLDTVLQTVLRGTGFTWQYSGKIVIIRKAPESIKKKEVNATVLPVDPVITYMGIVKNEKGEPLAGATIVVVGSLMGTQTDVNGRFILSDVPKNAVIAISHVGYLTREIRVSDKNNMQTIILKEYVASLDETVVIAYGTTSQRLSTGNVGVVKAADIERQPVNNPLLALEGRVPGLVITQANGLPGSGVTVRIQGQNSLNKGNDPLYVIDGVPYTSQLLPTTNSILGSSGNTSPTPAGSGNPLSFINPADIESISVLKDADATSIYGSRAAAGAILITTKKGKAGPTRVNVNMQNGWGQVTRKLNLLSTKQYLQMRHEAKLNDNAAIGATDYDINGTWDTTHYTDWQKKLIGGTAHYTDIQGTVSGGSTSTQFLMGAGYHKETTVFPGDLSDQKGSLHLSVNNTSLNQKFRLQLSGNYMVDNNQLANIDFTTTAIRLSPVAPSLYNADGTLNWAPSDGISTWTNPLSYLYNKLKIKTNNLVSNALISYQILPGLDIKSNFGYTNLHTNEITLSPLIATAPENRPYTQRQATFNNGIIDSWIIEPQATYKKGIGKGKIEALVGVTIQQSNSNQQEVFGYGYNSDLVLENIQAAATLYAGNTTASVYKYNAVFGRLNYNWADKYIVNLNARRDGSSRFGSQNRFHNFGNIAGAWIFSNEKGIQNEFSFLSFGKLRASYGTTGNDQIGDYQFLNQYSYPINTSVPYQGATGLVPIGLPNPYLQWEETRKLQASLDVGILADKILLNVNYFRNKSSNQLSLYALPAITGFTTITKNFPATIQNKGWEFSLNTKNITTKHFNWSSNVNLTIPRNKLVAFPNLEASSYSQKYVIGQPITILRLYTYLGVDPATGIYQFIDSKGNPTSRPNSVTDRTIIKDTSPKFYGSFQNSFRYKGIQLDVMLQFMKQIGRNYIIGIRPGFFSGVDNAGNQPFYVLQRWQKTGDVAVIQKYSSRYPAALSIPYSGAGASELIYSDASFIRLKNISLSWQLPEVWKRKTHLQDSKIYLQGQNLLTFTKYKGLDPENKSTSALPPLRVLTLGIQVQL